MATITITDNITDDEGSGLSSSHTYELSSNLIQLHHNVLTVSNELRLFAEFGTSEQGAPIKINNTHDGIFGVIINRSKTQKLLVRLGVAVSSDYIEFWVRPNSFFILNPKMDVTNTTPVFSNISEIRMRFENVQEQVEVVLFNYDV